MSKTIKILQCRKCGEELYRKEQGMKNTVHTAPGN